MKLLRVILLLSMALAVHGGLADTWKKFKSRFGRNYNSTEDSRRLSIFKRTENRIKRHNSLRGTSFKMAHNFFSDMTPQEMKRYLGFKPTRSIKRNNILKRFPRSAHIQEDELVELEFMDESMEVDRMRNTRQLNKRAPKKAVNARQKAKQAVRKSIARPINNKRRGPVSPSRSNGPVSPTGGGGPVSPTAGGSSPVSVGDNNAVANASHPAYSNDTSDAYDLRIVTPNCILPVKDQGACGSCWAFAAIAPLEYMQCKKTGQYVELSIQQQLECTGQLDGCAGGDPMMTYDYLRSRPSLTEASYPYRILTANYGFNPLPFCWDWLNTNNEQAIGARMVSHKYVGGSEENIKKALHESGVVANCIYVPDSGTLQSYASGVYSDPTCGNKISNHCTAIVGYGVDAASKKKYWIILNEWGTEWGMGGYVLWERGSNMCQVEKDSAIYTVEVE